MLSHMRGSWQTTGTAAITGLAPGADVLARAWPAFGAGGYDKQVDGPATAASMNGAPEELQQLPP